MITAVDDEVQATMHLVRAVLATEPKWRVSVELARSDFRDEIVILGDGLVVFRAGKSLGRVVYPPVVADSDLRACMRARHGQ